MPELEQTTDFKPKSLDDIMSNAPEPAPETPETASEPPKTDDAPKGTGTGETKADEAPKGAETAKEPAPEPAKSDPKPKSDAAPASKEVEGLLAGLKSERQKRQNVEAELHALKRELKAPKRPDPIDDPDGAAAFDKQTQADREYSLRSDMSIELMRTLHDDYDETEAVFVEEASRNPALASQLASHPMPAKFAYEEGKRLQAMKALGPDPMASLEDIVAKATEAGRKAALEEMKKAETEAAKDGVPKSLADVPSATSRESTEYTGPTPLKDILAGRRR